MTTHELAKALRELARILRQAPDIPLSDFKVEKPKRSDPTLSTALLQLSQLSSLKKSSLIELIYRYDLPIPVRRRDATRDILSKVLSYLENNPEAKARLQSQTRQTQSSISPELQSVLSRLLAS